MAGHGESSSLKGWFLGRKRRVTERVFVTRFVTNIYPSFSSIK